MFRSRGSDVPPVPPEPQYIYRIIVQREPLLTEAEIDRAFAGSAGTQWYKALVQIIDDKRQDNIMEASRAASAANTHAMAGGLNVYEALSGLLIELDKKVNATNQSQD